MSIGKPLDGKRIVVTRSLEQSRELKDRLEKLGATVLLFPAVSFSEPADSSPLDLAIGNLQTFDWILFTSGNAVRFFAGRCRKANLALEEIVKPRCAAVGPATATAAATEGFAVSYVAREFVGTALARELSAALAGKRILLPRSDRAGRELPEALVNVGAEITEVVTYRTGGVGVAEPGVLDAIREARVDVISFFSPSAVDNLREELGTENISHLNARVAFAAVGPVTSSALRNAGLPARIEAPLATADSMAGAILKYFTGSTAAQAGTQ
jgi:uroporphyrinogen-III synthase